MLTILHNNRNSLIKTTMMLKIIIIMMIIINLIIRQSSVNPMSSRSMMDTINQHTIQTEQITNSMMDILDHIMVLSQIISVMEINVIIIETAMNIKTGTITVSGMEKLLLDNLLN